MKKYRYYIYIITHPKFEGWVKLGRTNNPTERLRSYQTGCPNREYVMNFVIETKREYLEYIENYIHSLYRGEYEWYESTIDEMIRDINYCIDKCEEGSISDMNIPSKPAIKYIPQFEYSIINLETGEKNVVNSVSAISDFFDIPTKEIVREMYKEKISKDDPMEFHYGGFLINRRKYVK